MTLLYVSQKIVLLNLTKICASLLPGNATNVRTKSAICAVKMLRKGQEDIVNIAASKVFKVTNVFTATSVGQMKISNFSKLFPILLVL